MRSKSFVRVAASALAVVLSSSSLLAAAHKGASKQARVNSRAWLVEQNVGQTGAQTGFIVHRPGLVLGTTDTGYTVAIGSGDEGQAARLEVTHSGARAAEQAGVDRLEATANYFLGADTSAWKRGVPTFGAVRSEEIYPGISVTYSGSGWAWTSQYEVAPGANLSRLHIAYGGATGVELEGNTVRMMVGGNFLLQQAPYATQTVDGETREVAASFTIDDAGTVGVDLGEHDTAAPVTVETNLALSAAAPRTSDLLAAAPGTEARGATVDAAGNVYVVGTTSSANFLTSNGAYDTTFNGTTDTFVAKFMPDGITIVWATYIGGSSSDYCDGIALGADGSVYVGGYTFSNNLPTSATAYDQTYNSLSANDPDGYVAKLSADGSQLVYSTYVGGTLKDSFNRIKVDAAGNAYLIGSTGSSDFPTTDGAWDRSVSSQDAIVVKLNADGSQLVYSTMLGGTAFDTGLCITVGADGSAYVAGIAAGSSFPTTAGAYDTTYAGNVDAYDTFVTKLSPAGDALVFSTFVGGTAIEQPNDIALDPSGNVVVGGVTSGDFPTTADAPQRIYGGGSADAFVAKLDPAGSALLFATYLGGSVVDRAGALAVDGTGNIYISGRTSSANFPVTGGAADTTLGDANGDIIIAKFTSDGALAYSTFFGGTGSDNSVGIAVDATGAAFVPGYTSSKDIVPTPGSPIIYSGFEDGVLVKVAPDGSSFLGVALLGERPHSPETAGVYNPATAAFFLRNSNSPGDATNVFTYGAEGSGFVALTGDWNNDGVETPGLYDPATGAFFLKNSNGYGGADIVFTFGGVSPDLVPLAGDWNNDGIDTIGLYNRATGFFFLRNANSPGTASPTFSFGPVGPNVIPVVGDWNGDGTDSVGVYVTDTGAWFLRNFNSRGPADLTFAYGPGGAEITPLVGDWDGTGSATVGVYNSATGVFSLRNANTPGNADISFPYGAPGLTPLAGRWQ
jgi:hypothetical protein